MTFIYSLISWLFCSFIGLFKNRHTEQKISVTHCPKLYHHHLFSSDLFCSSTLFWRTMPSPFGKQYVTHFIFHLFGFMKKESCITLIKGIKKRQYLLFFVYRAGMVIINLAGALLICYGSCTSSLYMRVSGYIPWSTDITFAFPLLMIWPSSSQLWLYTRIIWRMSVKHWWSGANLCINLSRMTSQQWHILKFP